MLIARLENEELLYYPIPPPQQVPETIIGSRYGMYSALIH